MYHVTYFDKGIRKAEEFLGAETDIRSRMRREGKVILSLKKAPMRFNTKVSTEELYAALSAISDMISAGIPVSSAIEAAALAMDTKSNLKPILHSIKGHILEGKELSAAFRQYSHIFGNTTICMVLAGENSGKLGESLFAAAEYLRSMAETKSAIMKQMAYPVTILAVSIVSMLINTLVAIPKILHSELFKMTIRPGEEENIYIKVLRWMSVFMPSLIAVLAVAIVVVCYYYKTRQARVEGYLMKVPVVKEFIFYRNYYIAFYSLSQLVGTGVRLDSALEIVRQSSSLFTIRAEFERALGHLRAGESFVKGFTQINTIERTMLETAGNLDKVHENLVSVSKRFYKQYLEKMKSLSPKIYGGTIVFVVVMFLVMFMGIMVPYSRILGGIK